MLDLNFKIINIYLMIKQSGPVLCYALYSKAIVIFLLLLSVTRKCVRKVLVKRLL